MDNKPDTTPVTLVILAAGIGSRYGGLKQIAPLGPSGEILLDYAIYDAIQAGIRHVVFLIRRDMEALFRETIGQRFEKRIEVTYAFQDLLSPEYPGTQKGAERKKPWGTGHAILSCAKAVNGPFIVINADDFYGRSAYRSALTFLQANSTAPTAFAMVAYRLSNTLSKHGSVARGVCKKDSRNQLTSVVEEFEIRRMDADILSGKDPARLVRRTGDEPVSMNFWAFTPALFPKLAEEFNAFLSGPDDLATREFMIPTVIQRLIDAREITVELLDSQDSWFGVTYPQDVPTVREELAGLAVTGIYPSPLFG